MGTDIQIVCHKCAALNRLPQRRLQDAPKCGKCHRPLFSGETMELTDGNFPKVLSGSGQTLLVLFWAPWCGYCQKTWPDFKRTSSILEPDFRLATLNTETNRFTAQRYTVRSLPTLILFKEGKEIARQAGALNTQQIAGWARSKSA